MEHLWQLLLTLCIASLVQITDTDSRWAEWWTYDEGISGPNYWGRINPSWSLCTKGHNQSPVNIDPKSLLYDPSLSPLEITGNAVSGTLINVGHTLTFDVDMNSHWSQGVNITGGPLSYSYRAAKLSIHFSHSDQDGSEHTIDGRGFSAEIQIFAYNSDLYTNLTYAMTSPRGVVCLAVLVKIGNETHPYYERIHRALNQTLFKGNRQQIAYLNLRSLLPDTHHFLTYDGSLTHPACHETVTWIIYNKPIYISKRQITGLRRLKQDTIYNPVTLMAGNIRPLQPLNQRTVRTNINYGERACSMKRDMNYIVNYSHFYHTNKHSLP
ncbi:carbonic anhydrase-related protein 10-like [Physella acuta]|uniref:carbonic anhydrase-related protein 10-like n=1 Tax=Physella acuta TaxID=109671 RepID=UPI0027DBDDBC|nr:carbonic anhydrase-related protein 10-like [Physella acuta]